MYFAFSDFKEGMIKDIWRSFNISMFTFFICLDLWVKLLMATGILDDGIAEISTWKVNNCIKFILFWYSMKDLNL